MTRLFVLILLVPTAALAHTGDHDASGLLHLVSEPDHIAMIVLGLAVICGVALKLRAKPARAAKIRARK